MPRERIDRMLVQRGFAGTRSKAQALLMEGRVTVDGRRVEKAGTLVDPESRVEVAGPPRPFASRGGLKLAAALDAFAVPVEGLVALDVGSGTGGFTDCLLKRGAARVYAVDVGKGQLDHTLRIDPRVTAIEGLNARFLEPGDLPGSPDVAVMDVSFISATLILPRVAAVLRGPHAIVLVKPQFEVGRELVGRGGIVREPASWRKALTGVIGGAAGCGFHAAGVIPSPITGAAGNHEFLLHLLLARALPVRSGQDSDPADLVERAVAAADASRKEPA